MLQRAIDYCVQAKTDDRIPKYVKLQCAELLTIFNDEHEGYIVNESKVNQITALCKLIINAKGVSSGQTIYDVLLPFQACLIISSMCIYYRNEPTKRRYQRVLLRICRKNAKTFITALILLISLLLEQRFSKFYSVAPTGALSKEVKTQLDEFIRSSPAFSGTYQGKVRFKCNRDVTKCQITDNEYIPLNYSNSTLDGRLPTVAIIDEVGALPNSYAIEAMNSGGVQLSNRLIFVISTAYPKVNNVFEGECDYSRRVLDGYIDDSSVLSFLFDADNPNGDWQTDDLMIAQANPLAIEVPVMWDELLKLRQKAIENPASRGNFLTKHMNIIATELDTESYVDVQDVVQCQTTEHIEWEGKRAYVGVDFSQSSDNTAVVMCRYDEDSDLLYVKPMCFVPAERVDEKQRLERCNYKSYIDMGLCIPCGDYVIDYAYVEKYVVDLVCKIEQLGYDRYNCIASANHWEQEGITCVEVKQSSMILHPAVKWLSELIVTHRVVFETNPLYVENFENAKCMYDGNLNRYVSKKKSHGKVDLVMATLNAIYLIQNERNNNANWVVC